LEILTRPLRLVYPRGPGSLAPLPLKKGKEGEGRKKKDKKEG